LFLQPSRFYSAFVLSSYHACFESICTLINRSVLGVFLGNVANKRLAVTSSARIGKQFSKENRKMVKELL